MQYAQGSAGVAWGSAGRTEAAANLPTPPSHPAAPAAPPPLLPACLPPRHLLPVLPVLPAARYGDEEAVEDFLAIGKDVNEADKEGRTPIHYVRACVRAGVRACVRAGVQACVRAGPLHARPTQRLPWLAAALGSG